MSTVTFQDSDLATLPTGTDVSFDTGVTDPGTQRVVMASDAVVTTADGYLVTDNAAFTDGSNKVRPAGYILDEVAGTALTENDAGAARMDSKRAQIGVIEDETTRGRRATVTAAKELVVGGSGTAGTASAAVHTIQGIASMTPVQTDLTKIGGNSAATAGVNGTLAVGGNVATNVAIGTNPINNGAQAVSSENTAVTTARMVQLVADLVGKLIVLPYANPENFVVGVTAAITDTTSTSTIASQGGSVRTYITSITVTNSHATVGTFVKILDGSTIIWEGYAAAGGGGFTQSFPVPLRGSAATAVNTQCVTTGANVIASIAGYKGV